MRIFIVSTLVALLLSCLFIGCIESFEPPVSSEEIDVLVVEGFLDASNGMATVFLSRTQPLTSTGTAPPVEGGARVHVEHADGAIILLAETQPGKYEGMVPGVNPGTTYRIRIQSTDDRIYASDFIRLEQTPPIDSISLSAAADGIELQVNTHDETGKARYFKWNYTETYEYNSAWNSMVMFQGNEIVYRPPDRSIHTCWQTNKSTSILVNSTERLSAPVVSRFPLLFIQKGSVKFSRKYSLLVRQQALTREAYQYWLNLQKSTEQLGGLFDPLPSEVSGNIKCISKPDETVIGYFSGGTVRELRIFITPLDLPEGYYYVNRNYSCALDTIPLSQINNVPKETLLVTDIFDPGRGVVGYSTAPSDCIDCRLAGGDLLKPDFWE